MRSPAGLVQRRPRISSVLWPSRIKSIHGRWMMSMLAPRGTMPSTSGTLCFTLLSIFRGWNFELVFSLDGGTVDGGGAMLGCLLGEARSGGRLRFWGMKLVSLPPSSAGGAPLRVFIADAASDVSDVSDRSKKVRSDLGAKPRGNNSEICFLVTAPSASGPNQLAAQLCLPTRTWPPPCRPPPGLAPAEWASACD